MGMRILIVDDSASVRGYHRAVLAGPGWVIEEAANGYEALEKALRHSYDLFLVDVNMPQMDGYELVRQLRELPEYRTAPVVLVTTEAGEEDRRAGFAAGANAYLVKPARPAELRCLAALLTGAKWRG